MIPASLSVYLADDVMASNKSPPCEKVNAEVTCQNAHRGDESEPVLALQFSLDVHLDELHNKTQLRGRVHLLNQHDDVGVFYLPQHSNFILYEVFLETHTHTHTHTNGSSLMSNRIQ